MVPISRLIPKALLALCVLASCLLASCLLIAGMLARPAAAAKTLGPLHSHNDYEQRRPLELALSHGFQSVEADIWHWDDELQVGHLPLVFQGTLSELYLQPLLSRVVNNRGSVHGDGRTFLLWLDFKDSDPASAELLREELAKYPIFTEFRPDGIRWRAVTVILTGNEASKKRFVSQPGPCFATRDSEWISSSDPVAGPIQGSDWLWYALDWRRFFSWNGQDPFSPSQRAQLRALLAEARRLGRQIRFFNTPDRASFWRLARDEGLDLVGTDRVEALAEFWKRAPR